MLSRVLFGASLALCSAAAWGQSVQCSTCDDCTRALAAAGAQVQLTGDLALRGAGPCVTVRGEGARLDGQGHVILAQPAGGTGVLVEAAGAGVRNLRVTGAEVGVRVSGTRDVTLYNVTTEARGVGFSLDAAPGVRLERVRASGGRVGASFGASADGTCAEALPMRSPGAVIVRSTFERAGTGVAACDARPVLTGDTVTRNGVGVLLGHPAAGVGNGGFAPYDPCACAPGLANVRPGTVTMFSSGCGGCQVHEGWMPSLRRRGADIVVRESGPHTEEAQARFDRYGWRCIPGVMDSLGIPGCVPNYACVATGTFSKRRQGAGELAVDVPINGEDDALRFARECAGAAQGRYARGGPRCVVQGLADNAFCNNRTVDLRALGDAARAGGVRNRCGTAEGWSEGGRQGCSQGCDAAPEPAPLADLAPPAPEAHEAAASPTPAPVNPAATPAARPAPEVGASSGMEAVYVAAGLVLAAVAGAWVFRKKG